MGHGDAPQSADAESAPSIEAVPAMMEDHLALFTPGRGIPSPLFALFASCAQLTSCQLPETLGRGRACASVRRAGGELRTDWMLASSLRCFCIALTWSCALPCCVPLLSVSAVRALSIQFRPSSSAPFFGRSRPAGASRTSVRASCLPDPVRVGVAVREVQLRAQVGRVGAHGFVSTLWPRRRALGQGSLKNAPPHDLRAPPSR